MKLPFEPLRGIVTPMITPLTEDGSLDQNSVAGLVEHLIDGGVSGIFVLGTTGEGPSLSDEVQSQLINETCKVVAGRRPVLVGITDTAFARSVETARRAADAGANAVVLAPPSYFATNGEELLGYVARVAEASPLPLHLYNMPNHTKTFLGAEIVLAASEIPGVVGFKDSSGDMTHFHRVRATMANRPEFNLLVGPEELLAEAVLFGAHGGVNGGSNLAPQLYVDLFRAAAAGDLERTRNLHEKVIKLSSALYTVSTSSVAIIQGLKCAMSRLGLCGEHMAEPFRALAPSFRNELLKRFDGLQEEIDFQNPGRICAVSS